MNRRPRSDNLLEISLKILKLKRETSPPKDPRGKTGARYGSRGWISRGQRSQTIQIPWHTIQQAQHAATKKSRARYVVRHRYEPWLADDCKEGITPFLKRFNQEYDGVVSYKRVAARCQDFFWESLTYFAPWCSIHLDRNASASWLNFSGYSSWGVWPAWSKITNREPFQSLFNSSDRSRGTALSSRP